MERGILETDRRSVNTLRHDASCARRVSAQRRHAVPLPGQIVQPFAEKRIHPQAVTDQLGGRRIHADRILPAPPDIAMRGLGLPRIVTRKKKGRIAAAPQVLEKVASPRGFEPRSLP